MWTGSRRRSIKSRRWVRAVPDAPRRGAEGLGPVTLNSVDGDHCCFSYDHHPSPASRIPVARAAGSGGEVVGAAQDRRVRRQPDVGPSPARKDAYPSVLQAKLKPRVAVSRSVNQGVSGDTTARALAASRCALAEQPQILIVELGVNDGLARRAGAAGEGEPGEDHHGGAGAGHRGPALRDGGAAAAGMAVHDRLPPDVRGPWRRTTACRSCRFVMNGVLGNPDLISDDGVHPNAAGARYHRGDDLGISFRCRRLADRRRLPHPTRVNRRHRRPVLASERLPEFRHVLRARRWRASVPDAWTSSCARRRKS